MKTIFTLIIASLLIVSPGAFASTGKEFTTSVIYGTLAGALVGAATLAFTSNPGDNLNNVARGASYGLYAGILLGIYVTYGVNDTPEPDRIQQEPGVYEEGAPTAPPENKPQGKLEMHSPNKVALFPILPLDPNHPHDWGVGAKLLDIRF